MKSLLLICLLAAASSLRGATIQALVDATPPGGTVHIPAGIYRETVTLKSPITIVGDPGAELRGSDVWSQWDADGKYWKSALAVPPFYHYGYGGQQSKWPEQVFINGTELHHVASDPAPGEFALDAGRHVLLGQSPQGATVEVTMRQNWFTIQSDGITIRNLRMQYAASDAQANAALPFHHYGGGTIEGCTLSDTHGCVVSLGSGKGNRLINCEIYHGGQTGLHASDGSDGDLIAGNRIHDNDRSDYDAGWDGGGIKVARVTHTVFENNEIWGNRGPGLWCDIDCGDITIQHNRIHGNGGAGIHYEISRGAHITGNVTWDNGRAFSEWGWGAGILLSSSRESEVDGNLVAWNPDGISVVSANRGQDRWNQVVGVDVHDNVVIGTDTDPRDPNHNNIYAIAFLQDWKGILGVPSSNNHAENNRVYLPGPDRSGRFARVAVMPSLDAFNHLPGCTGNTYIDWDQAEAILKTANVPMEAGK